MKKIVVLYCFIALALFSCKSNDNGSEKKEPASGITGVVSFKDKDVNFADHEIRNVSVQVNLSNAVVKSDPENTEYQVSLVDSHGNPIANLHVNPEKLSLTKSINIKDFQIRSDIAPVDGEIYASLVRSGKQVLQSDFIKYHVSTHLSDVEINKDNINAKYNAGAWLDKDGMFSFDTSTGLTGSASFITDSGEAYFDLVSNQKPVGDKVGKQFISSVLLDGVINNTIFKTEGVCPKGWQEEYDQQQVLSASADGAIKIVGIICQDQANPKNELLYSYFLNNGALGKLDFDDTPIANGPIFYQGISNNGKYLIYDNLAVDDERRGEDTIFDLAAKKSVSLHNPDGTRFALSSGVLSLADNASVLAYRFDDVEKQDEGFTFMLCSAVNGSCKDIIHSEGSYYDSTMSDNGQFIYLVTETNKVKKLLVLDENAKVIKENPFDINQFKAKYGFDLTVYNSGVLKVDYMDETSGNRASKFYSYSSNKMVSLADVAKALHLTRKSETDNMLNINIDISSNGNYALVLFSETNDPYYNGTPLVSMNRVFVANGIDSLISGIMPSK